MKIIIGRDGWVYIQRNQLSYSQFISIRYDLSNIEPWSESKKFNKKPFSVFIYNKKYIKIPRGYAIINKLIPTKSQLKDGNNVHYKQSSNIQLRQYQSIGIQKILDSYSNNEYGGIIVMPTGSGKTFLSLGMILKLGKKALIVVRTIAEIIQWEISIKNFYKSSTYGRLSDKCTHDISITTIKSLMRKKNGTFKFKHATFYQFGIVILDEVHSAITNKSLSVFTQISRRYILALTATPHRIDNLHKLYTYYIGNIIYKYDKLISMYPNIHYINYNSPNPKKYCCTIRGKHCIDYVKMWNIIQTDPDRLKLIIKIIRTYANMNKICKILIVSRRRSTLEYLYNIFKLEMNCGLYYSVTSKKDQIKQKQTLLSAKIIFAIYDLAKQSLSITDCNCMILLTCPILHTDSNGKYNYTSLDQIMGRVMRKKWDINPTVVILNDMWGIFKKHVTLRNMYFINIKKMLIFNKTSNYI